MIINGVELEDLDIFDADVAEKYEKALNNVMDGAKKLQTKTISNAEAIREQCKLVFNCFDELFENGTSEKVFGNKSNLLVCMKAFDELVSKINDQKGEIDSIISKYSPNRAQRRVKK